ncbi:hypothetical protein [Streptacidiphilus sp. EB103A]|uniref:hypothetical protein n=1 Tax=Streptacidiphilus sp. EB103A TaxID=3156275 RepID=UPI00351963E5
MSSPRPPADQRTTTTAHPGLHPAAVDEDRFHIEVPRVGTVEVQASVMPHGLARYAVRGPRATGVFVVAPEVVHDGAVLPCAVRVRFGDGDGSRSWYTVRELEPVINGVTVAGSSPALDPDHLPGWLGVHADAVARGHGTHHRVPDRTAERLESVLRALLGHWRDRSDRADLVRAAAAHRAVDCEQYEQHLAAKLRSELAELRSRQAAARRRVNQITGLQRRAEQPVLAPAPDPVHLPFFDDCGARLGVLTVRERLVNAMPGRVVYDVDGARVQGAFTVGPDRSDDAVVPAGLFVAYGHWSALYSSGDHSEEPTVNGVRLSHGWSPGRSEAITLTSPERLPASTSTGRHTAERAPKATARRASGVLRALALHYLARPDLQGLRQAAGRAQAPERLEDTRRALRKLRADVHKKEAELLRRESRAAQYRALLEPARKPRSSVEESPGSHSPLVPLSSPSKESACSVPFQGSVISSSRSPMRTGRSRAA